MWIPKGAALTRGRRLFEARRLLEEIRYLDGSFSYIKKDDFADVHIIICYFSFLFLNFPDSKCS